MKKVPTFSFMPHGPKCANVSINWRIKVPHLREFDVKSPQVTVSPFIRVRVLSSVCLHLPAAHMCVVVHWLLIITDADRHQWPWPCLVLAWLSLMTFYAFQLQLDFNFTEYSLDEWRYWLKYFSESILHGCWQEQEFVFICGLLGYWN